MAAAADPRTDVSRCSSCRRWAGPPVGAEKCKQRVGSLDPHALMMLQLSHTPHSSLRRVSHAALMRPPAFMPLLSLRPRFFFRSTPASLRFCRPVEEKPPQLIVISADLLAHFHQSNVPPGSQLAPWWSPALTHLVLKLS